MPQTATPPAQKIEPQTPAPAPTPLETAVEMTPEQEMQRDREIFRRITGTGEPGGSGQGERSKPETPPASGAKPPTASPTPTPPVDEASRRELKLVAEAVFKRDGLTDSARKRLIDETDPKDLEAMVNHRRKVQIDQDRLGNKLAEVERKGTKPAQPPEADGQGGDDLADLTPAQAKMVQKLVDEGDDPRAKELLAAFRDGKEPAQRREAPRTDGLTDVEREELLTIRLLADPGIREPLDRLTTQFPQLKGETERRAVIKRANRLMQSGVFERGDGSRASALEVMETAASVEFGKPSTQDAQRRLMQQNYEQRNGQPEAGQARGPENPPIDLDGKDRDRQAFRLLQKGHTPDEVSSMLP